MRSAPLPVLAVLPVLSACLATLSLPSFDAGYLAWVALAPLFYALRQRGPFAAMVLGWLFGCAFGATSFFWITIIPGLNPVRFALLVLVFSLYYLAFGWTYAVASRRLGSWMILGAPLLWVSFEYLRGSAWFLAYPWNFLAHSQHRYLAVIQISDLTGAYGVSFVLVMVNQLASKVPEFLTTRGWRWRVQAVAVAVAVGATMLYGSYRLGEDASPADHLRVALVQANVAPHANMSAKEQMAHLAAYDRLTREVLPENPELIVWPSSSLPGPIDFWMIRLYVNHIAKRAGIPVLIGGAGGDKFAPARNGVLPFSNSEFLVLPAGTLQDQYNKIHLTPFTEHVPLQGVVSWPRWMTTLEKSFVAGDRYTLFRVGGGRFGAPICWENSFPDLFRRFVLDGANFMVSVTNESVFGASDGPHQTLAMNAFRAVENRIAVARAATTGVSAFIDSRGRIVAKVADPRGVDLFVAGVLTWDVPLSRGRSFYTVHGDVFAQACALLAACLLLISLRR